MAYSDYGGFAYKNGKKIIERSDASIKDAEVLSTPGMWPGWVHGIEVGSSCHHALLGDKDLFVGLYKQSSITFILRGNEIKTKDLFSKDYPKTIKSFKNNTTGEIETYFNADTLFNKSRKVHLEIEDYRISFRFYKSDNYYCLCQLIQPDGTVWHGFSGYGVGAGFEENPYGYDTEGIENQLFETFPYEMEP
jgi:hypothetical protein